MEESRERGIKSQQRITMDNQHSLRPQPFLKISRRIKLSVKNLWQFKGSRESGARREHVISGFWWLRESCVNIH